MLPGEYPGEEARSVRYGMQTKPYQDHQKTQDNVPFFKPEKERGDHDGNTDKVQDAKNNEPFLQETARCRM